MQLRTINTEKDYVNAMLRIAALMKAGRQADMYELDVLVSLTEEYEEKHFPNESDALEALRFGMSDDAP